MTASRKSYMRPHRDGQSPRWIGSFAGLTMFDWNSGFASSAFVEITT